MKRAIQVAVLCAAVLGCQRDKPSSVGAAGRERGDCRPDHTCEPGLWCLSDLCVRPPPADCDAVAAQLTSLDLGNYAEPEDRAPVVARYVAGCKAAMVSKEEGACIDKARDAWTAKGCAPRMFPELAARTTGDCAAVVARTRQLMVRQAPYLDEPASRKWFDLTMDVMKRSCEEDHWPDQVKQCVLADNLSAEALQACNQRMPPALQQKMQDRLTKAQAEFRPQ